jgi:hypothetical protein
MIAAIQVCSAAMIVSNRFVGSDAITLKIEGFNSIRNDHARNVNRERLHSIGHDDAPGRTLQALPVVTGRGRGG